MPQNVILLRIENGRGEVTKWEVGRDRRAHRGDDICEMTAWFSLESMIYPTIVQLISLVLCSTPLPLARTLCVSSKFNSKIPLEFILHSTEATLRIFFYSWWRSLWIQWTQKGTGNFPAFVCPFVCKCAFRTLKKKKKNKWIENKKKLGDS